MQDSDHDLLIELRTQQRMILDNHTALMAKLEGLNTRVVHLETEDKTDSQKIGALTQAAGTYTPGLTNDTNVAASTATGPTVIDIDLPIASDFASANQCAGTGFSAAGEGSRILADTANNRATMGFTAVSTSNTSWWFSFMYVIV